MSLLREAKKRKGIVGEVLDSDEVRESRGKSEYLRQHLLGGIVEQNMFWVGLLIALECKCIYIDY